MFDPNLSSNLQFKIRSDDDIYSPWSLDKFSLKPNSYKYNISAAESELTQKAVLDKKPAAGLIYVPAKNRMFYSYGNNSSFELIDGKQVKLGQSNNFNKDEIKFVSYSNKLKPEIETIHKKLNVKKFVKMKSSLKFCVIAAGEYDGYVAEPRACEWDIAAGHAILKHAGGSVTDFNGKEIFYGKISCIEQLNVKKYKGKIIVSIIKTNTNFSNILDEDNIVKTIKYAK